MIRTLIFLLITNLFLAISANAQINGMVAGTTQEGATIALLQSKDSSVAKLTVAGNKGLFSMQNIGAGKYLVRVSNVGFSDYLTPTFEISAAQPVKDLGMITLQTAKVNELGNVNVTAKRPMMEVKADKTIVNVDAMISTAGATALEILEKSPGVTVDKDGNISMRGKQGVMVMIDGKPTYLSGQELTNLLTSMNANQLDQIEMMTNPPAKYDALGNAGIINIRTKRSKQRGWNGNVNLGYGQGRYYKFNNSLGLNYRNEKMNVFLNYNQMANKNFNDLYITRTYYDGTGTNITGYFKQPTNLIVTSANNTLKAGIDYYLNKKTTIGLVASGFVSPRNFDGVSTGYLQNAQEQTDSVLTTYSNNSNRWKNGSLNANLRHQFSKSEELSVDLDYVRYNMTNNQLFTTTLAGADSVVTATEKLKGDLPSDISIYSAKVDWSKTFEKGLKVEAGWKSSYVETDNIANYFNEKNGQWEPDYNKTNHFIYKELINAAYLSSNKKLGKWNLQAGLRFENTNYNGKQMGNPVKADSSFKRSYSNLFPTVFASYELDSNHTFGVNIGRRIDRPVYQQLNPFLFFINKYTYQVGNPFLQPQFTSSIELSHTFKNKLTTIFNHSRTTQYFSQLFRTEGEITILTQGNLSNMRSTSLTMNWQMSPWNWWTFNLSATGTHRVVNGNDRSSDFYSNNFNGNFNLNNTFKMHKGWSAELSGNYSTAFQDAQFTIQPMGQVSAGVAKSIWQGKGTIKLTARDIFFTQVVHGAIRYQNVQERFVQSRDSRVVNINFTYRFGKNFSDNRKRNGNGSSEEQRRVGAGG